VSELAETLRETLAALAASDPSRKRFGAAHHRYELAPPAPPAALAHVPDDLAEFVTTVGASGAGPAYGFAIGRPVEGPWGIGVTVAHLGCGYAAIAADSGVWIDARAIGRVGPIAPSFTEWYVDWIECCAHNRLPAPIVPPGVCPLPNALSGFLGVRERELGLAEGTLAGDPLREALEELGPGAIAIAAEASALFPDGTRVSPCLACAQLVENLAADGLRPDVVQPG